jgi:hypothetical protein
LQLPRHQLLPLLLLLLLLGHQPRLSYPLSPHHLQLPHLSVLHHGRKPPLFSLRLQSLLLL